MGRQKNFMKSGDLEELKLKREWQGVELRKSTRTENFMKKRRMHMSANPPDLNLPDIDSQLAFITSSVPFTDAHPHLLTLEKLSSRGVPEITVRLVDAGMVPLLLREFHAGNSNLPVLTVAVHVMCDLLTTVPDGVHIREINEIFENAARLVEVEEVTEIAMLIIGNILMDGYHTVPIQVLERLAVKTIDTLELPSSNHSLTSAKLFAMASFLLITALHPVILDRSVDTLKRYCGCPYEPEYASELIRGLTTIPSSHLTDSRVMEFLMKHIENCPAKVRAYQLVSDAFSLREMHVESHGFLRMLEGVMQSGAVAVRRLAYKLLWEATDFYSGSKEHLTKSILWHTAVKGVSDSDEEVQFAAVSFYLCFGTNFAYQFMEIAEDLVTALTSIKTAKETKVQLVPSIQIMMDLLLHLTEVGETYQRWEKSRFGSIVTTKIEELGILDLIEPLTYSENKEVVDKAFEVLMVPSDTLICLEEAIPPTTGFVFS